jgi:kynurenine formamidase
MLVLLSYPVSGQTPLFPGTPSVRFLREAMPGDLEAVSTTVQFDTHSGTHVDAPSHYCPGGLTVEEAIRPCHEFAPVLCVDAPASGTVGLIEEHIASLPPGSDLAEGVLLRTGMHRRRREDPRGYSADHPFLEPSLVRWLLHSFPRLKLLGIDCVSIAHPRHAEEGGEVHRTLLCRDPPVLILEDMDLSLGGLSTAVFRMIVLPLLHDRLDGTPAAVLALLP